MTVERRGNFDQPLEQFTRSKEQGWGAISITAIELVEESLVEMTVSNGPWSTALYL